MFSIHTVLFVYKAQMSWQAPIDHLVTKKLNQ